MKQYEINIARRLALGSGGKRGSSPAVKVAQASVALSIAVMLLAIGVVFGFKEEITRKIQGFNPHITLYSVVSDRNQRVALRPDDGLGDLLDAQDYIADWEPVVNTLALIKTKDAFKGIYLNGLSTTCDTTFLRENLTEGRLPDFAHPDKDPASLLISRIVADQLSLSAGDSISVYSIGEEISLKRMKVSGIYNSHFDMFDNMLAFAPLSTAATLGGYRPGEVTRIDITTGNLELTPGYADRLNDSIQEAASKGEVSPFIAVDNIYNQCGGIFGWLALLDTNVWVILILLTLVSSFTLISGMLIIILEKVRFIGVMKALGASSASIRHIFIWLAMRIGFRGMLWGTFLGFGLLALQYFFHLMPLDADSYYMDYAPVAFRWWAFAAVEVMFALIIYLVLVLPSRLISRISPSESMRFE